MVKKFEIGKIYRFTGDISKYGFLRRTGMLDSIPRKCIASNWKEMIPHILTGNFEGIPRDPDDLELCWDFSVAINDFEEVTTPTVMR